MSALVRKVFEGVLCAVLLVGAAGSASAQGQPAPTTYHLSNMHTHPWFWEVLFASVVGWVLGQVKGFASIEDWLDRYWPRPPRLLIFLGDLLAFAVIGGYFGTGIYNPDSLTAAIAAGLSWPLGIGALATRD